MFTDDFLLNSLFQVMPLSFANGYKISRKGKALFLTYGMDAPIPGKYGIYHGNIDEIEFSNGWTNFYHMN